ncbi:hypothetical protein PAJ34TS1_38510 [Paenibacillus azoreducens]|uniref:Uncharacterized protein n=1 Tax=Paenibacillus azoreducens TaxID=116718 RepID=A0A919YAC2_9BACL|nr:hypothetical protein J34TS1_02330 [Paenibacillus azoreducens]
MRYKEEGSDGKFILISIKKMSIEAISQKTDRIKRKFSLRYKEEAQAANSFLYLKTKPRR